MANGAAASPPVWTPCAQPRRNIPRPPKVPLHREQPPRGAFRSFERRDCDQQQTGEDVRKLLGGVSQADLQKYQVFIAPPGDEPKEEKVKGSVGKGIRLMEQEISKSEVEDDVLRVPARTEDLERLLQKERT